VIPSKPGLQRKPWKPSIEEPNLKPPIGAKKTNWVFLLRVYRYINKSSLLRLLFSNILPFLIPHDIPILLSSSADPAPITLLWKYSGIIQAYPDAPVLLRLLVYWFLQFLRLGILRLVLRKPVLPCQLAFPQRFPTLPRTRSEAHPRVEACRVALSSELLASCSMDPPEISTDPTHRTSTQRRIM
jgi:hypothetical protein